MVWLVPSLISEIGTLVGDVPILKLAGFALLAAVVGSPFVKFLASVRPCQRSPSKRHPAQIQCHRPFGRWRCGSRWSDQCRCTRWQNSPARQNRRYHSTGRSCSGTGTWRYGTSLPECSHSLAAGANGGGIAVALGEVHQVVQRLLLQVREEERKRRLFGKHGAGLGDTAGDTNVEVGSFAAGRQQFVRRLEVKNGQANLFQVVAALRSTGRLACTLHGRKQRLTSMPMMAITTSSSISVKPGRGQATACDLQRILISDLLSGENRGTWAYGTRRTAKECCVPPEAPFLSFFANRETAWRSAA